MFMKFDVQTNISKLFILTFAVDSFKFKLVMHDFFVNSAPMENQWNYKKYSNQSLFGQFIFICENII